MKKMIFCVLLAAVGIAPALMGNCTMKGCKCDTCKCQTEKFDKKRAQNALMPKESTTTNAESAAQKQVKHVNTAAVQNKKNNKTS